VVAGPGASAPEAVRVLVTGSGGFVGHWLGEHLAECGDEVIGIDAEVDVADAAALRERVLDVGPDAVVHLAARASVADSWASSAPVWRVNALGSANLLDAAVACPVRPRVLLVSSSEVYGRVPEAELPIGEDRPFAPVNPYAATKAAAELAGVQAWLGAGLEVIRVRPFNHTGPGQRTDFVVPALAAQIARALDSGADSLVTGNLDARRDLTDVRDVVRAYRGLLEAGVPGQVYNVCRGEAYSIRYLAERLMAAAGVDLPIVVDPARVRPVDVPEVRGDPSRIAAAIGWRPEIGLDRTLADVLDHWKNAGG
jgi:GDP-4-dehydro-6-deoxy-D-mannose reductase